MGLPPDGETRGLYVLSERLTPSPFSLKFYEWCSWWWVLRSDLHGLPQPGLWGTLTGPLSLQRRNQELLPSLWLPLGTQLNLTNVHSQVSPRLHLLGPEPPRWRPAPLSTLSLCREQPIFSTRAHVFQIDPATKRNWIPAGKHALTVSYFYDATRNVYRIISIGGAKVPAGPGWGGRCQGSRDRLGYGRYLAVCQGEP